MASTRPFAYNTGGPISGTTDFGSTLISGDIEVDYSEDYGGVKWWMGPDEDLGYVIGNSRPGGQPVPSGVTGTGQVGFWRSKFKTNESFLDLANYIGRKNGQPPFANTTDAENWLNSQGYYSSYNIPTPTPSPTSTVTPTPTETNIPVTPTNTPTVTQTPTSTDLTSVTTYTISGCTSLNVFVADLGPGALAPGDVFYFEFTGGTPSGCYRIVNKIDVVPTDGTTPLYFYTSCALCVAAREVTPTPTVTQTPSTTPTNTPTPTNTETPTNTPTPTNTETPTNTPTPSTTSIPITGYGFNLVALPYQLPTSGNSIMENAPGIQSGATDINVLTTVNRGFYFNEIDNLSINRSDIFSAFTGQSITITFNQGGNIAIYSGDTNSFQSWTFSGGNGYVFGTVSIPPAYPITGQTVLIQSATTNFIIGQPVYVSAVINSLATPTPTPTNTSTPTPTPTVTATQTPTLTQTPTSSPAPKFSIFNNSTGNRAISNVSGGGPWSLTTGSYPVSAGQSASALTHFAVNPPMDQFNIFYTGSDLIDLTVTKNGSSYYTETNISGAITSIDPNTYGAISATDLIVVTITDAI